MATNGKLLKNSRDSFRIASLKLPRGESGGCKYSGFNDRIIVSHTRSHCTNVDRKPSC